MQFRIPQFLDIEDKVFGPFTFKQFAYLLGALAFAYIFWKLIPYKIISILLIFIFSGTFLTLAFVKVNDRPFVNILEAAYKFLIGNKTYVWVKKEDAPLPEKSEIRVLYNIKKEKDEKEKLEKESKPVTLEKIKDLSGRLDILDEEKKTKLNLREELLKRNKNYQI